MVCELPCKHGAGFFLSFFAVNNEFVFYYFKPQKILQKHAFFRFLFILKLFIAIIMVLNKIICFCITHRYSTVFHKVCVENWLVQPQSQSTCPLCRTCPSDAPADSSISSISSAPEEPRQLSFLQSLFTRRSSISERVPLLADERTHEAPTTLVNISSSAMSGSQINTVN